MSITMHFLLIFFIIIIIIIIIIIEHFTSGKVYYQLLVAILVNGESGTRNREITESRNRGISKSRNRLLFMHIRTTVKTIK